MVHFDGDSGSRGDEFFERAVVVVFSPVAIDDVVAKGSPPRLPAIDSGGDGGGILVVDDHSVPSSEGAVYPP